MLNIQYQLSKVKTQNELTIFVKMSLALVNEIDKNELEHECECELECQRAAKF